MTLSSTILVPELNHYFFSYITKNCAIGKFQIEFPVDIVDAYLTMSQKSFIRLLFDDEWPVILTLYDYLFREITNKVSWPGVVRDRMGIFPQSAKYYICDGNEECITNLFFLESDDFVMLDKLLEYRLTTTTIISDIDYDLLNTNLSKLIYLYLNLKINMTLEYSDETIICTANVKTLLEYCYEIYVLDNYFKYVETLCI
jgi:hypothetical protein